MARARLKIPDRPKPRLRNHLGPDAGTNRTGQHRVYFIHTIHQEGHLAKSHDLRPVAEQGTGGRHVDYPGLNHPYGFNLFGDLLGGISLELDTSVGALIKQFSEMLEGAKPGMVFGDEQAGPQEKLGLIGRPAGPRSGQCKDNKDQGRDSRRGKGPYGYGHGVIYQL